MATLFGRTSFADDDDVLIRIRATDEDLRYQITDVDHGDALIANCEHACVIDVPRGTYRLRLLAWDGRVASEQVVKARASALWTISSGDPGKRTTGLVLGVTGSVAFGVGMLLVATSATSSLPLHGGCSEDDCEEKDKSPLYYGLGAMVVGAVMAPVGWVMFAKNRTRVTVHEYDSASGSLLKRVRVAVAPDFKGGAAASVSVAF